MKIGFNYSNYYSPPKVINHGSIQKVSGESVPYTIELGLSKSSINECNGWKDFTTEFIIAFVEKNPDVINYKEKLQGNIMLEDYHWDYFKKALFYNDIRYNWFFLKTPDGIQSVCLTFHPKKSVLQNVNIFYIQYLSSAPWNRKSSFYEQKYKGAGKEILKQIQFYFLNTLHYNYGFSLHSLPQAQKFYEYIGMINLPEYNDENGLLFYEIDRDNTISFLEDKNERNR